MSNSVSPDLIVIGAGIFGLWQARHGLKRGERVLVLEKRRVGAGASGGFLGALMPHMPDIWNAKKQMQFEGLSTLAGAIGELEADTGMDCGYRRCGRLMPLKHERMIGHVEARIAGAAENWLGPNGEPYAGMEHIAPEELEKRFTAPCGGSWLSPDVAVYGAQSDTLSARVNPRAYLAALAAYVRGHARGEIAEGMEAIEVRPAGGAVDVIVKDGSTLSGSRAVIANGWEAYGLLGRMGAQAGGQPMTGRGVKGQAVLLDLPHNDELPILYDDGSYVIPHGAAMGTDTHGSPNRLAVGATSLNDWLGEGAFAGEDLEKARTGYDRSDTRFLDHARAICPALSEAPVVERWANIRPRNTVPDPVTGKIGTEPVFAPLDGHERISAAVGGFKISFGIGHLVHEQAPAD